MFVHGDNLRQKMDPNSRKYNSALHRQLLREIEVEYVSWHSANEALRGPFRTPSDNDEQIIEERTRLFNEYKDFIDQPRFGEAFDSRSNLHSSVLEEFMYYLFRDLVAGFSNDALIGKSHAFKDIFFRPGSYEEMIEDPCEDIEVKDHDFVIGIPVDLTLHCAGSQREKQQTIELPAVAIECKTYLDKTMLESCSTAAAQLKERNPDGLYIVVAERLKLTSHLNIRKYKVDQIYVLRKERNVDREFRYLPDWQGNPIYADVVFHLFSTVREHLTTDWENGNDMGIERGFLL